MNFFGWNSFVDKNWNFDNAKFMSLLSNSRHALKTGRKPSALFAAASAKQIVIGGISEKDVWRFINKLASFLNSWVDMKTAFSILNKETKNPKLKKIILDIRENLDQWLSISETLTQYQKYFDPLIIALVQVWEKTGTLPRVLNELDARMLESIELKSKIRGAMIYPVILISITLLMVTFMMVFIIPKVTESFVKTGVDIPALTRFVMNISEFITGHYVILILAILALGTFAFFFRLTHIGKLTLSYISLRLPVFGFIARQNNIILFINSFNLLLESGVLMLEALETSANVVPNLFFKRDIIRIKNEVETGIRLSHAMWLTSVGKETIFQNAYFPEDLVHMVNVGEETGTIGKTIQKVWNNYQKELRRYIGNLMTMLEPFIIVFIGAIVGTVVIAVMLPFFNLAKVAKKM